MQYKGELSEEYPNVYTVRMSTIYVNNVHVHDTCMCMYMYTLIYAHVHVRMYNVHVHVMPFLPLSLFGKWEGPNLAK